MNTLRGRGRGRRGRCRVPRRCFPSPLLLSRRRPAARCRRRFGRAGWTAVPPSALLNGARGCPWSSSPRRPGPIAGVGVGRRGRVVLDPRWAGNPALVEVATACEALAGGCPHARLAGRVPGDVHPSRIVCPSWWQSWSALVGPPTDGPCDVLQRARYALAAWSPAGAPVLLSALRLTRPSPPRRVRRLDVGGRAPAGNPERAARGRPESAWSGRNGATTPHNVGKRPTEPAGAAYHPARERQDGGRRPGPRYNQRAGDRRLNR